ncbi:MAG TPA: carboxypeptidase-like regulatory domain-containing protein, partial [Bacteroidales bacterium]|nr:carboxypeptidase-like regulatory domain-containing protein [Bacteroidales bacterium]
MQKKDLTKAIFAIFMLVFFSGVSAQENTATVFGKVSNREGLPVEMVNIVPIESQKGVISDTKGNYSLPVKANDSVTIAFTFVGFKEKQVTLKLKPGEEYRLDITLAISSTKLPDVIIEDKRIRRKTITAINPKTASKIPGMNSSIESLVKTMPGVSSKNEMSNQYSVRGGNFDENLIYVNDIRIYRPFLVRSGRQEGLSFINSDLVSSVLFSAGGFDAKYGDKMSSVLDITYKKPDNFGGSVSASLLGASFHLEDATKDKKFSYL